MAGNGEDAGGLGSEAPTDDVPAPAPARTWDCAASDVLAIPFTDIEIEPFTLADEEAERDQHRDSIANNFTFAPDHPRQPILEANLTQLEQVADGRDYDVTVIEEPTANAFIVTGGSIFITTGLLLIMDDDEVTAILAHEVAHGVCRHLAKQVEREALAVAGIDAALGGSIDVDALYDAALGDVISAAGIIIYSKEDESEADLVSLELAEAAGFEPRHLISAFEVFLDLEGNTETDGITDFLSTHPQTQDRIDAINEALG